MKSDNSILIHFDLETSWDKEFPDQPLNEFDKYEPTSQTYKQLVANRTAAIYYFISNNLNISDLIRYYAPVIQIYGMIRVNEKEINNVIRVLLNFAENFETDWENGGGVMVQRVNDNYRELYMAPELKKRIAPTFTKLNKEERDLWLWSYGEKYYIKEKPWWKNEDAISTAASKGGIRDIKSLIKLGKDINFQDEDGETALISAIDEGYDYTALYLIDMGADVNLANNDGDYALDLARWYNKVHHCNYFDEVIERLELLDANYNEGISKAEERFNEGNTTMPLLLELLKNNDND